MAIKISMTLVQRLGVVSAYQTREKLLPAEQMVSIDVIDRINPTDEQRDEWLLLTPVGPGQVQVSLTPAGREVGDEEFEFSRSEASDLLNMLTNTRVSVNEARWVNPLIMDVKSAIGAAK